MINTVAFEDKEIWSLAVRTLDGRREDYRARGNHPFWVEFVEGVEDKGGWTAVELLQRGDQLRLANGEPAFVDEVFDTGEIEAVYNMEVEGFHTYHIGELGVWVHNTNCPGAAARSIRRKTAELRNLGFQEHHIIHKKFKNHPVLQKAGWDIDAVYSKMMLPDGVKASHASRATHRGRHNKIAQRRVGRELNDILAKGKLDGWPQKQYHNALSDIVRDERLGLRSGALSLNGAK